MKKTGIQLLAFIAFAFTTSIANSKTIRCSDDSTPIGEESKITEDEVSLFRGPGTNYDRVKNEKTSRILNKTIYASVDTSVIVFVECSKDDWSYVRVIDPAYLSESHRGWIQSKYLEKTKNIKIGNDWFSDWSYEFRLDITKILASKKIRGCGEYRVRKGITNKDLCIVSCSVDGENWTNYKISLSKKTVEKL